MTEELPNPFRLGLAQRVASPFLRQMAQVIEGAVSRALSLQQLADRYEEYPKGAGEFAPDNPSADFANWVLDRLGVTWDIAKGALEQIPRSGPVLIVANHPLGALEGVVLVDLLSRVRPDARIMANFLLNRIPELRESFIAVDPFGGTDSKQKNIRGMSESLSWLRSGKLLGVFPSGTVSHFSLGRMDISDPAWTPMVVRLARRSGAVVVPLFFHGTNSFLFHAAGLLNPYFRTALLPREFMRRTGSSIRLSIGSPIPASRLEQFRGDADAIEYLRLRTYILGSPEHRVEPPPRLGPTEDLPLAGAIEPATLQAEIDQLPKTQQLLCEGKYEVWFASATQIPQLLREIGRLRELTFRAAGEGTGKTIDLDVFDNFYTHLFLFDRENQAIVGAYRLAKVDEVLKRFGRRGLYTHTLFSFRDTLLQQLGKAIELGRSFVVPQYQRDYSALLYLWQGIARYVAAFPQYRVLFGPVSISNEYNAVSRQLIIDFLKINCYKVDLAREVKPRTPFRRLRIRGVGPEQVRVVRSLADVTELLREVELSQSSVPVLLRQYLKLGAKLIGYNLDPNFSNVLDALVYVDLTQTDPRLLERYMGEEAAKEFLARHSRSALANPLLDDSPLTDSDDLAELSSREQ